IYRLRPQEIPPVPLSVLGVSLLFFVGLLLLSLFYGRMYCNLICPVGTLLGLISRFSLFGFAIDADKCKACDRCAKSCKAGCIDGGKDGGGQSDGPDLDPTRCVACFNCLEACRKSAIRYGIVFEERKNAPMDRSKRKLMVGTASMGAALAVSSLPARSYGKRLIPDHNGHPAAPPGSSSVSHFNETCTACHLCIHVCQTQVLNPALFEYGLKGILQPVMDFDRGKCAYECKACGDVCPSGAISPLALDVKKLTKIGSVKLLKEICITHKEDRDCGACAEVCPTHAVYTEIRNNVRYPEITPDPCTGCGACQFVCPTQPDKAILVEGDVVHSIAQKPFQDEKGRVEKPPPDTEEKFPF
ncbi:MAG: 4Fe-4S dicluster domain-containing protein, partial [Proteobacteria bacterium]|nr:4Fe-4S dicluster domain-containing protein [Pseudomonadota bacterium]